MHDDDYEDDTDTDACPECGCTVRSMEELAIENAYLVTVERLYDAALDETKRKAASREGILERFRHSLQQAKRLHGELQSVVREEAE